MTYKPIYHILDYANNNFPFYINKTSHKSIHVHKHDAYHFMYIANGKGTHKAGNSNITFKSHDIIFIDIDKNHYFKASNNTNMETFTCMFLPEIFSVIFNDNKSFWNMSFFSNFFKKNKIQYIKKNNQNQNN